jgi:hypothetical protein
MDRANMERISKALANETRLLIFEAIARNNRSLHEQVSPRHVQSHRSGAYWCYDVCKQNSTSKRQPSGKRRSAGSQLGEDPQA